MLIYLQMLETEEERSRFEQLYRRYARLMFHVAFQILQNQQDAEDAVHQAFLSILKNFEKISQVECPKTRSLLVIIVERKSIDLLRARSRRPEGELDEEAPGLAVPLPGDGGLADAMAKLPARYREVLLLRYDNGYSTKEIARLLDMTRPAAQKLLWRAKEALRKSLEEEGMPV